MKIIKILCLDQSTRITGYSLWSYNKKTLLKYGYVKSNTNEKNPLERMKCMYEEIKKLINNAKPNFVVLEQTQFHQNFSTYHLLSQLQGVLFTLLFEKNINFCLVEPTKWKSHCGVKGKKRAEQKANTIQIIKDKYQLSKLTEDEADAIGMGLWAIHTIEVST